MKTVKKVARVNDFSKLFLLTLFSLAFEEAGRGTKRKRNSSISDGKPPSKKKQKRKREAEIKREMNRNKNKAAQDFVNLEDKVFRMKAENEKKAELVKELQKDLETRNLEFTTQQNEWLEEKQEWQKKEIQLKLENENLKGKQKQDESFLSKKENEITELTERLKNEEKTRNELQHKVVIYESTRSMLESSNQDLKQDIKEKIGMINDLRSDISNVKKDKENEISNLKREKENDISNLKRKKENLEISLNEITRKSTEYSEKLTNMGAQKDKIQRELQEFRTTCNNAKIEIACLKNSLDNSQNLNKRLEVKTNNDFVKIECKYQKLEEKFEKTMEAKQNLRVENETFKIQIKLNEDKVKDLISEKESLRADLHKMNDLQSKGNTETQNLVGDLSHERATKKMLEEKITELKAKNDLQSAENSRLNDQVNQLTNYIGKLEGTNQSLELKTGDLRKKQEQDLMERRKLHNKIMELKGNIRVFCRVRPFLQGELTSGAFMYKSQLQIDVLDQGDGNSPSYQYDRVFQPTDTQEDVFNEVDGVVQSALDGYNVCIFAFGQTSSGKTYTMEGANLKDHKRGIIPRTAEKIFKETERLQELGWNYEIYISILEIYNEDICDLLDSSKTKLKIRHASKKGSEVVGLTQAQVRSLEEIKPFLARAKRVRSTGTTASNEKSSRSHCVVTITIKGKNEQSAQEIESVCSLIDLAGSERLKNSQVKGDQLKETKNINTSLHHLKSIISSIAKGQKYVGYRNSKLTSILKASLKGQAKVLMIINLCPGRCKLSESMVSLRFGSEANSTVVGTAKKNLRTSSHK